MVYYDEYDALHVQVEQKYKPWGEVRQVSGELPTDRTFQRQRARLFGSVAPCYNDSMTMKNDLLAYRESWNAVAEIEQQELQSSSIEHRWRQLNSVFGLAIGLDILKADPSEEGIYLRWAKLKETAIKAHQQRS